MSGADVGQYVRAAASASADFTCARLAWVPEYVGWHPLGAGFGGGGGTFVSVGGFGVARGPAVRLGAGFAVGDGVPERLGVADGPRPIDSTADGDASGMDDSPTGRSTGTSAAPAAASVAVSRWPPQPVSGAARSTPASTATPIRRANTRMPPPFPRVEAAP
ncbi:hypothetical protein GCM10017556_05810 [Micromonospora sagamiensis]|nr:hypothetical protein GCM10017556_05810 [Micromonospora sagamiensis]